MRAGLTCWIAVTALLLVGPHVHARGQILAGVQANWKDLETWSRAEPSTRQTELGLGLHPIGGAVVAFLGRLSVTDPSRPPSELRIHVAPAYMTNPNVLRTATLIFLADAGEERQRRIDVSAGLIADDATAGGIIQNAIGPIRAADFVRLTQAERLTANVLGFDVTFRPDQIRAMQEFAKRLSLR
jgi:hypothetical protein